MKKYSLSYEMDDKKADPEILRDLFYSVEFPVNGYKYNYQCKLRKNGFESIFVLVKENSAILNGLLVIFIIAIIISLFRGLDINCGCFGTVDGAKVGLQKILENIGLLILGFVLIKFDSDFLSLVNKN